MADAVRPVEDVEYWKSMLLPNSVTRKSVKCSCLCGCWQYRYSWERHIAMAEFAERRRQAPVRAAGSGVKRDPRVEKDFPATWDLMTTTKLKDGTSVATLTILVFCQDGLWKACVNDRQGEVSSFVSAETALGLLQAIEEGLAGDSLEWRASKPYKRK